MRVFFNNYRESDNTDVHFYMLFNENLLNEKKLAEMVSVLENKVNRKSNELFNRQSSYRDYLARDQQIRSQTVTKSEWDEVTAEIDALEGIRAELADSVAGAKQDLADLNDRKSDLENSINELKQRQLMLNAQLKDLSELVEAYSDYLENKRNLSICVSEISDLENKIKAVREQQAEYAALLTALREKFNGISYEISRIREKAAVYEQYEEAVCPADMPEELRKDMDQAEARYLAITDKVSHEIQELEENAAEAAGRQQKERHELDILARKYSLTNGDWKEIHFSEADKSNTERQLEHYNSVLKEENEKQGEERTAEDVSKRNMEVVLKDMEETCEETSPMSEYDIRQIDYKLEKTVLISEQKKHRDEVDRLKARISMYDGVLDALEQYRGKPDADMQNGEAVVWEGEEK